MANSRAERQNANANPAGDTPAKEVTMMDTLLKAANIQISDNALSGMFRGAIIKSNPKVADLEKLTFGAINSAVRIGEFFRIVALKIITQNVQGTDRDLLLFIVENPKGEQRPIYASSLFRTTPTANSEKNKYDDSVLKFEQGILKGSNGMSTPKRIEKLVGDGKQFIEVVSDVAFTVKANRTVQGPLETDIPGSEFETNQRVFQLEHVTEEEAKAGSED